MAKNSRNVPGSATEGSSKPKKSAAEVKKEIVGRTRKIVRRSVARLQAAEVRTSGNPEGNWELLKAYKAFDEQLSKIAGNGSTETPAAQ